MTLSQLVVRLNMAPLVASCQASEGSPLANMDTLGRLAEASVANGCSVLRLEGAAPPTPLGGRGAGGEGPIVIGLIKRAYPGSDVYITPTETEVDQLLATGCEVIALDGTQRPRPSQDLAALIARIKSAGRLAMADCDNLENVRAAFAAGADIVGTTLSGYTGSPQTQGPDLELVRAAVRLGPVLAEGRYREPWQAQAALRAGAVGVVIGGALNDPVKQTRRFAEVLEPSAGNVGAVDIGGTWLRFGVFSPSFQLLDAERISLPDTREARLDWIRQRMAHHGIHKVGIGTGGTVDPATHIVWEAKPIIPGHEGTDFRTLGNVTALNDGLATAWGHACHPDYAGRRAATLALGTGVGFGLVDRGRIICGPRGDYMRLNDVPLPGGETFEDLLGGAALSPNPSPEQIKQANAAAQAAVRLIETLYYPDDIILAGGVGLASWLQLDLPRTPYGADAGLYGAAALVLYPLEPVTGT